LYVTISFCCLFDCVRIGCWSYGLIRSW
jgi:hypothetical protein